MAGETDQRDRVALAAALRSIADEVVRSRRETGLETEAVTLDLQFALDSGGADIKPVVFLEPPPRGVAVHRLRCTLRLDGVEREVAELGVTITDEPKRAQPVTLPPQAMPTINDEPPPKERSRPKEESSRSEERASHTDKPSRTTSPPPPDTPPREEVAKGAGVLLDAVPDGDSLEITMTELEAAAEAETKVVADPIAADEPKPEPKPEHSERKRPQIVLPTNPRLKLRKASDAKPRPHPGDERPAQRTELEFDPPEERERPRRNTDEPRSPDREASPFLIFDHQVLSKRAAEGKAREGDGQGPSRSRDA